MGKAIAMNNTTPQWKWIVAALFIIVVAIGVSWVLTTFHTYRLNEGFSQPDREQKSLSFVNSVKQAESFSNGGSITPPASVQQQRKTSAYLKNGIATFFSTNTDSDVQAALSNYHVFFQPTQSDLQCDFTNISTPSSCISPVDTISTNDTAIPVPASIRSTSDYAIGAPNASLDTRVFVLGSVYNISRISINVHCAATPSSTPSKSGASTVILALPTKDYATRLLMLIRPTYVRAASSGVATSMLYWVDWSALDGEIYESNKSVNPSSSPNGTWNTLIKLVQVAGFDQNGIVDPISATAPLPPIDVAINGGRQVAPIQDPTPLRTMPISVGTTSSIVLYYPKYSIPTPFGPQDPNAKTAHVATLYASIVTGAFATLADAYGNVVISVSCPGGPNGIATVSVPAAGNTTFSVKIPAGSPAYAVACASHDMVTVALVTPNGTTIATQQLVTPLTYFPGKKNGLYTYGGGASEVKVGNYSSTSIPNYAEIALLLECLHLPPAKPLSGVAVESFTTNNEVLMQGESLLPGDSIVSQNGAYAAIYQLNGNLGVYRTSDSANIWDSSESGSSLLPNSVAGKCSLGRDGILKLTAGGLTNTLATSQPYWTSASGGSVPGADQAPFNLIVTDMGKLQVTGKFSATPVWESR